MTHDELLARIELWKKNVCLIPLKPKWLTGDCKCTTCVSLSALRAVVELHKPVISQQVKDTYPNDSERRESEPKVCEECSDIWEMDMGIVYPCLTIQAIEKELN